jgi:hypothetical protein
MDTSASPHSLSDIGDEYARHGGRSFDAFELDDGMGEAHDLSSTPSTPRFSGRPMSAQPPQGTSEHISRTHVISSSTLSTSPERQQQATDGQSQAESALDESRQFATRLQKKVQDQASKLAQAQARIQELESQLSMSVSASSSVSSQHLSKRTGTSGHGTTGRRDTSASKGNQRQISAALALPSQHVPTGPEVWTAHEKLPSGAVSMSEHAKLVHLLRDKERECEKLERECRAYEKRCDEYAKRCRDLKHAAEESEKEAVSWRRRARHYQQQAAAISPDSEHKMPAHGSDSREEERGRAEHRESVLRAKIRYLEQVVSQRDVEISSLQEKMRTVEKGLQEQPEGSRHYNSGAVVNASVRVRNNHSIYGDEADGAYVANLQVAEWKGKYMTISEEVQRLNSLLSVRDADGAELRQQLRAVEDKCAEYEKVLRELAHHLPLQSSTGQSSGSSVPTVQTILAWKTQLDSMLAYVREASEVKLSHANCARDFEKVKAELFEQQSLNDELLDALRQYKSRIEQLEALERANGEQSLLIQKLNAECESLRLESQDIHDAERRLERVTAERDEYAASLQELTAELDRIEQDSLQAVALRRDLDALRIRHDKAVAERAVEKKALSEEIAALKMANDVERARNSEYVSELEEKITTLNNEAESMEIELQEKEAHVQRLDSELARTREEAIHIRRELEKEVADLNERISALSGDGRDYWRTQWEKSEELRGELRAMYDQVCREKSTLEMQYAELRYEAQMLQLGSLAHDKIAAMRVEDNSKHQLIDDQSNRQEAEALAARYLMGTQQPQDEEEDELEIALSEDDDNGVEHVDAGSASQSDRLAEELHHRELQSLESSLAVSEAARQLVTEEYERTLEEKNGLEQQLQEQSASVSLPDTSYVTNPSTVYTRAAQPPVSEHHPDERPAAEVSHKSALQERLERVRQTFRSAFPSPLKQ